MTKHIWVSQLTVRSLRNQVWGISEELQRQNRTGGEVLHSSPSCADVALT